MDERATAEQPATTNHRRAEVDLDAAADRLRAALAELEGEVLRATTPEVSRQIDEATE